MREDMQNSRYEEMYTELRDRAVRMHENNRKRLRQSFIVLILLPFILAFIRWITDSDKTIFLLIWVFFMFAISIYMLSIEYVDESIIKGLDRVSGKESGIDSLMPDSEQRKENIKGRIRQIKDKDPAEQIETPDEGTVDAVSETSEEAEEEVTE